MPAPIGRPTDYSPEVTAIICERMAVGESLRSICRDEKMPSLSAVMNWLNRNPDFVEQYARARELQAEYLFDEIIEIADDATNDYMLDKKTGGYIANGELLNRSRLRVDARKWAASKMAPKKYGDKLETKHTGDVKLGIGADDAFGALVQALDGAGRTKAGGDEQPS